MLIATLVATISLVRLINWLGSRLVATLLATAFYWNSYVSFKHSCKSFFDFPPALHTKFQYWSNSSSDTFFLVGTQNECYASFKITCNSLFLSVKFQTSHNYEFLELQLKLRLIVWVASCNHTCKWVRTIAFCSCTFCNLVCTSVV
jgi:hypothetical protein